jgi:hypothetical protein
VGVCVQTLLSEFLVLSKAGSIAQGPLSRSEPRQSKTSWIPPGVGRAGWRGAGPVEAEKDPGEQGVQAEPPAGARPTPQPLDSIIYPFFLITSVPNG